MEFSNKKLTVLMIAYLLVLNFMYFFNFNFLYIRTIFSFMFLIIIPGLLIMLIMKIEVKFWEYLVYTIGVSIAFLLFAGLFVNIVLPLIGIDKPLSLNPLLFSFNLFILILLIIAYKRNEKISLKIRLPILNRIDKVFLTIPMIFPLLSILGVFILNNKGPNYLTMAMLGGIAIYVFFVIVLRDKFNKNIYPFAILMICISLLLMFSMRSKHILGWDIHLEYLMFQLTKEHSHWSMSNFPGNAYNACLSITILPTIFSRFLTINDEYIFKLVAPFIFSTTSVCIYLFLKRFSNRILAFIAIFFFVSQPRFISEIPALVRQQFSLLFFSLSLLVLFNKKASIMLKRILFIIFGFSMIVSHYSTTYIALILFTFVYFLCFIFRKIRNIKPFFRSFKKLNLSKNGKKLGTQIYCIRGFLLIILISFTFFWSAIYTKTTDNLVDFTYTTINNMGEIFNQDMKSMSAILALLPTGSQESSYYEKTMLIQNYIQDKTFEYQNQPEIKTYSEEKYSDYIAKPVFIKYSPAINFTVWKIFLYLKIIIKSLVILFFLIGTIYLLFINVVIHKTKEVEYALLSLGCVFLIIIILFLPYVSIGYSVERLYQQALVVLSLPAVFGAIILFKYFKSSIKMILVAAIFCLFFLIYSSFIPYFIGGEPIGDGDLIQLGDFGTTYEQHYVHEAEIKSAQWLSKNYNSRNLVYADELASLKLLSFGRIKEVKYDILPSTLDENAYVYLSYANVNKNMESNRYKGSIINYSFPMKFINENKNLIYNNGGSELFK